jgi:hypothetical protein
MTQEKKKVLYKGKEKKREKRENASEVVKGNGDFKKEC